MKRRDRDEFCDKLGLLLLLGTVVEVIVIVAVFLVGWWIGGWQFSLKPSDPLRWAFGLIPAIGLAWILWMPSKRDAKK